MTRGQKMAARESFAAQSMIILQITSARQWLCPIRYPRIHRASFLRFTGTHTTTLASHVALQVLATVSLELSRHEAVSVQVSSLER